MTLLRVGTRGSDLAQTQTNWVCEKLRESYPSLDIELVIIKTHGDLVQNESFGPLWPVGAFVSAIETALLEERIDLAVHSYKDLQTATTDGLEVAATPLREVVHDVLLTAEKIQLDDLKSGARIGTGSPRRAAQLLRLGEFEVVPIRGNVPTRIDKLESEKLDGIVLAAAGLKRLGISWPNFIDLPTDSFLPAPAQGALAVQVRAGSKAAELANTINDQDTRRTVEAERNFLREIGAGCHTPVGALANVEGENVRLHARLFSDDYRLMVDGNTAAKESGVAGKRLAKELQTKLNELA